MVSGGLVRVTARGSQGVELDRVAEALARVLADEGGPRSLCSVCPELLPVDGAALAVLTSDGAGRRETVCATDALAARMEEIELTVGEGPALASFNGGAPVLAGDLAAGDLRWPAFTDQALSAGIASVFAFPLRFGPVSLGSLNMYRRKPGALEPRDQAVALRVADAATQIIMRLVDAVPAEADDGLPWLGDEDLDPEEIYQATGMVMIHLDLTAEDALARLRAYAFAEGRTLREVARDVVQRRLRFGREKDR